MESLQPEERVTSHICFAEVFLFVARQPCTDPVSKEIWKKERSYTGLRHPSVLESSGRDCKTLAEAEDSQSQQKVRWTVPTTQTADYIPTRNESLQWLQDRPQNSILCPEPPRGPCVPPDRTRRIFGSPGEPVGSRAPYVPREQSHLSLNQLS